jgi:Flp pilus assembly protein TadB
MKKTFIVLLASLVILTGCDGFWKSQGDAAKSNAEARRIAAQAERDNAQAAIIDAQSRGTLAESQAQALTTSVDAVVQLSTVDDKYATIFALLLFVVVGPLVAAVGFMVYRGFRPARVVEERPKPLGALIDTPYGRIAVIQEPGEPVNAFYFRVNRTKALVPKEMTDAHLLE